jgi:hypothetical protein
MKKLAVIVLTVAAALSATAQLWNGTNSTRWDLPANWNTAGILPTNAFQTARVDVEWATNSPSFFAPVIDSNVNTVWGKTRIRGYGLKLTQTGGRHEWVNGTGSSSKGMAVNSRPVAWTGMVWRSPVTNTTIVKLTGGTMVTDVLGLGTTDSGTFYSGGGDYAADTLTYRNWQTTEGDGNYGFGQLHIGGTATFIVRPNTFVYPNDYVETTPYWSYNGGTLPTPPYCRIYDIAISTNSQMVISDFGKLVAPYKIYTNAILPQYNDPDLLAQLQYYAGLVQAGSPPHYVSNEGLSGPRLVAGPGQTLQFDLFPAGTNDVNEPYGGYFTVTAVPAPIELNILSVGSLSIKGLVGRDYRIESQDDLKAAGWDVRTNFTLAASPQTWNDPTPSSTNRFYRAALLPLP